jgi:hypothetical protein
MGGSLVLASITAVLKNQLENGMVDRGITSAIGRDMAISALPPDRIEEGTEERKVQLNLFLYQAQSRGINRVSRYSGEKEPSRGPDTPPTLELKYLLTAYGVDDLQAEVLLGYALDLFQDKSLIESEEITKILKAISSKKDGRIVAPAVAALGAADVADQVQNMRICRHEMSLEDMFNLWSAFQVSYRPSINYRVLVELKQPA